MALVELPVVGVGDAGEVFGAKWPGRRGLAEVRLESVELLRADLRSPPLTHVVEYREVDGRG